MKYVFFPDGDQVIKGLARGALAYDYKLYAVKFNAQGKWAGVVSPVTTVRTVVPVAVDDHSGQLQIHWISHGASNSGPPVRSVGYMASCSLTTHSGTMADLAGIADAIASIVPDCPSHLVSHACNSGHPSRHAASGNKSIAERLAAALKKRAEQAGKTTQTIEVSAPNISLQFGLDLDGVLKGFPKMKYKLNTSV